MANRIGVVLTTVAGGALAAAGGVGYHDLSNKLAEQQVNHTQDINNNTQWTEKWNSNEQTWGNKFAKQETDHAKLQTVYDKSRNDLSDLVRKVATQERDWEKDKHATAQALDNYKNKVLGIEEDVKNVSGRLGDTTTRVNDLSGRVDENGQRVGKLESGIASLSGKVGDVEKNYKIVLQNIEKVNSKTDTIASKINNIKTDEQRRIEIISKALPSVVSILVNNGGNITRASGYLLESDKGEMIVMTAGHVVNTKQEFLDSTYEITFKQGVKLEIDGHKMPNGAVPWSGYNDRDLAGIGLPEELQKIIKERGAEGLPILSPMIVPQEGKDLIAIGSPRGKDGSVTNGIFSRPSFYPWRGKIRRDYQLDTPINPGNSGGPVLNNQGKVVGTVSWQEPPSVAVTTKEGVPVPIRVHVKGNVGLNVLISNGDMTRSLLTWGFRPKGITDDDIKHLIAQDLRDHPEMLAIPMTSGNLLQSNIMPYLWTLSNNMDGYVFNPSINKK